MSSDAALRTGMRPLLKPWLLTALQLQPPSVVLLPVLCPPAVPTNPLQKPRTPRAKKRKADLMLPETSGLRDGEELPPKRVRRASSQQQPLSALQEWKPAAALSGEDKVQLQLMLKQLEEEGLPADVSQWRMRYFVSSRMWHCKAFGKRAPNGTPGIANAVKLMRQLHPRD